MTTATKVSSEQMTKSMALRERTLRRFRRTIETGKKQYVRYKVFIDGKFDKTITIRDHSYAEFERPFFMKFPEYKIFSNSGGGEWNHNTFEIKFTTALNVQGSDTTDGD